MLSLLLSQGLLSLPYIWYMASSRCSAPNHFHLSKEPFQLRQAASDYGPGSQANTVALQASKAGVPETENTGKIPGKSILNPERQLIVEKEERQEKE